MSRPTSPSDQPVRERAFDPACSFIVQAPDGSGKTELLIQRYLRQLACVQEPEQVLANTFTRKAAGEMRSRVIGAIEAAAAGEPPVEPHLRRSYELAREVLADAGRHQWQLPRHPSRLNISTIDSVNAWLAGRAPISSGSAAAPAIAEAPERLYREAARATLELLAEEPAVAGPVAALLAHLDNDARRFEDMLVAMLPRRDQWLRHVAAPAAARDEADAALRALTEHGLQQVARCIESGLAAELCALLAAAAGNLRPEARRPSAISAWSGRHEFPRAVAEDLPAWLGLAEALLTAGLDGDWRKQVNIGQGFPPRSMDKAHMEELLGSLRGRDELRDRLRAVRGLPGAGYTDQQWETLHNLLEVLRLAAAQLRVVFQVRGEADFAAVSAAAVDALGRTEEPTPLGLALDYRIQHILVDEFQDTSVAQYELLSLLTAGWTGDDGRTLFLVGDPMQSIYRFREAEVGLFLQVRAQGLGAIRPEFLQLTANFRSLAAVVHWNNRVFGATFPVADDSLLGAVSYAPSEPTVGPGNAGAVTCHWLASAEAAVEAEVVADLVQATARDAAMESICVLVRSRGHVGAIVEALRRRDLPFQAEDMVALDRASVGHDLLALTRALCNPVDRLAWIGLLRSPMCGLSLRDLDVLLGTDHDQDVVTLAVQAAGAANISPYGAASLLRLLGVLDGVRRIWGRIPLREIVEGAWLQLGGPATLRDTAELQTAASYLELLEAACASPEGLDVVALGDSLAHGKGSLGTGGVGVRIMTMHMAKGLEFDTVILPGLAKVPRGGDPPLLLWHDAPPGRACRTPVLASIGPTSLDRDPLYDYLKRLEQAKQHCESQRLLYVACTRARRQLHLLAHVASRDGDDVAQAPRRPRSRSLLAHLWPVLEPEARAAMVGQSGGARTSRREPVWVQPSMRRLAASWRMPPMPEPVVAHGRGDLAERVRGVEYEWASPWARQAGAVAHHWLQVMAQQGPAQVAIRHLGELEPMIRSRLSQLGVGDDDLPAAIGRVTGTLRAALTDPTGQWILGAGHGEAHNEWALTLVKGGQFVNVVIDRSFVAATGERWIIDYKTSTHQGAGLEEFLRSEVERYAAQLDRYREAVAFVEGRQRTVRCALYYPLLQRLVEVSEDGRIIG